MLKCNLGSIMKIMYIIHFYIKLSTINIISFVKLLSPFHLQHFKQIIILLQIIVFITNVITI